MPYNPASDFVGLWRAVSGGVEKAQMPGLDFVVSALHRSGLLRVVTSATPPVVNQSGTAWFRPADPSFGTEGALYLWNGITYVPATPELFHGGGGSSGGGGDGGGGDGGGGGPVTTTTLTFMMIQTDSIADTGTDAIWKPIANNSTPLVDTMGGWDAASKKYTPTTAGYYAFSVSCVAITNGGVALLKNDDGSYDNMNTDPALCIVGEAGTKWHSATCFAYMNGTTDYVRHYGRSSGGPFSPIGSSPPCFSALILP